MKQNLGDSTYEKLKNDIIASWPPLPIFLTEQDVANRYNVSRTPAREALMRLTTEGVVTKYPKKGYLINRPNEKEVTESDQLRFFIESGVLRYIIANIPDDPIRALYALCEREASNAAEVREMNNSFHLGLAALVENNTLSELLQNLVTRSSPNSFIESKAIASSRVFIVKHRNILNAILERNVEKAIQALDSDLHVYPR